jgi:hypothetical protein
MQAMWKVTLAFDVTAITTEMLGLGGSKFVRRQTKDKTIHFLGGYQCGVNAVLSGCVQHSNNNNNNNNNKSIFVILVR